jgi:hypothetical protein
MQLLVNFLILTILAASVSQAEPPLWSKDQVVRHISDNIIVVTCSAEAVSRDLSFESALHSCSAIAANEKNSEFTTKNIVIESESTTAKLYSSTEAKKLATNLQPKTEKSVTEPSESGFSNLLQVRYDLSKARVITVQEDQNENHEEDSAPVVTEEIKGKSTDGITIKRSISSNSRTYLISMMPEKCRDYLIRGKQPRTRSCEENPMRIMVDVSSDTEIILRPASSALLPKTLRVQKQRIPAKSYQTEVLDVQFPRSK